MLNVLVPIAYHYPSGSSGPVPCRWAGWVDFGAAGVQWVEVDAVGE